MITEKQKQEAVDLIKKVKEEAGEHYNKIKHPNYPIRGFGDLHSTEEKKKEFWQEYHKKK